MQLRDGQLWLLWPTQIAGVQSVAGSRSGIFDTSQIFVDIRLQREALSLLHCHHQSLVII